MSVKPLRAIRLRSGGRCGCTACLNDELVAEAQRDVAVVASVISPDRDQGEGAERVEAPDRVITRASAFSTTDLPERLRSKIRVQDDGCWIWTATTGPNGYGQTSLNGINCYSHRFVYELLVGPIPAGLQIDHLCRVRECCNPEHLEPVTCKENLRRGVGGPGVNARKTHCIHGHEFTAENTYWPPKRQGVRNCKQCRQEAQRRLARKKLRTRRGLLNSGAGCGTADMGAGAVTDLGVVVAPALSILNPGGQTNG